MERSTQRAISGDAQIRKFCLYGFLKNLMFFKPYIIVYLLAQGLSLFEIGALISIREITTHLSEIPSGIFADHVGRKRVLLMSFVFYMLSFVCFFFAETFALAAAAMLCFGLGAAFRSGTHKAMIFTYLELRDWEPHKTFVYGRTRSWSLMGTALSSLLALLIMLRAVTPNYIFLASLVPFMLAFLLVLSYPDELNRSPGHGKTHMRELVGESLEELGSNSLTRRLIYTQSFYEGLFKSIEDFIQPILATIMLGSGIVLFAGYTSEKNLYILLALCYAGINLINAFASRSAYIGKRHLGSRRVLNSSYLLLGIMLALLAICSGSYPVVIFAYLLLHICLNIRKPIFVDELGEAIAANKRATMLSVTSQLRALLIIVLAPLLGFLAEHYGMHYALGAGAIAALLSLALVWIRKDL